MIVIVIVTITVAVVVLVVAQKETVTIPILAIVETGIVTVMVVLNGSRIVPPYPYLYTISEYVVHLNVRKDIVLA